MRNRPLESQIEDPAKIIRQSFLDAIISLVITFEAKSEYTIYHSQKVARMSVNIANKLGMPPDKAEQIRIAGLVHDIGNVGVSELILNKQGQLTRGEFMQIFSHSTIGERLLRPIVNDKEILQMVKHHHERYDGTGYPDGLKADNIPIGARIIAVADAYDAMTSERPYRKGLSVVLTSLELKKHAGSQFDPIVVNAFFQTLKRVNKSSQSK